MRPQIICRRRLCQSLVLSGRRWVSSHQSLDAASRTTLLQHHHLNSQSSDGITSYDEANQLQEKFRTNFLTWKSAADEQSTATGDCPRPQLITFESTPTYTLGRRQDTPLPDQMSRLEQEISIYLPNRSPPVQGRTFRPDVRKTNRGGLTTYHGPGQIVLWPVLDMRSPLYPNYSVASYAAHLESTTQRLLSELFGISTYISHDEPGVWVITKENEPDRKIAALGVHHRRYVTALGIALNVDIPVTGPEATNPWARFVPCGLEGKDVTSIEAEVGLKGNERGWVLATLASKWASIFEQGLLDAEKRLFNGPGSSRPVPAKQ